MRFRSLRSFRSLAGIALLLLAFAACNGGGCSGCEGCGIAAIPGGFPVDQGIANAAQVRLTSSGVAFLEENIDGIIPIVLPDGLDFPVERSDQGVAILCSTDPTAGDGVTNCYAHVEVDSVDVQPVEGTNEIHANLRVIADSRDDMGVQGAWVIRVLASDCLLNIDTRGGERPYVGVAAALALEEIDRPAREGLTRLAVQSVGLAEGEGIETDDFSITYRNWWDGGPIACGIADLLRDTIAGTISGAVEGLLTGALDENLCTRRGELGCPTGTFDRGETAPDAVCYFDETAPSEGDECVPSLLGFEGRGDLGRQLLAGFAPGAHGPLQLSLAAGGDGESVSEGVSIFLDGGMMSFDRAFTTTPGHDVCVPITEPPPLPEVPRVDAFRGNVIPGTEVETHLGVGISEAYLDHAGWGMFDSGMLCLGAGTRLSQDISTGLVSALSSSLRSLAFPLSDAPLTIALRPQQPPDFTVGTTEGAPLLTIVLRELHMDFYVWSSERYTRFMTLRTDLTVRLSAVVEAGQIVLGIDEVEAANSEVTNSELLTERPDALAGALEMVVPAVAGGLAGAIPPISLPAIMGFELDVPPEGLRGVAEGDDRFIGVFADLRLPAAASTRVLDTELELSDLSLDRESMTIDHWGQGEGNAVWLHVSARGAEGALVEHSHRIGHGPWSRWSRDGRVRIDDPVLLLQADHTIEARSRIVGSPLSVDPTPASARLRIDVLAPDVALSPREDGGFVIEADDILTRRDALRARHRVGAGAWSEWSSELAIAPSGEGGALEVEVIDESGNVGSASAPLIRGIPSPNGGGCGCRTSSAPSTIPTWLAALAVALVLRRRALRNS